MLFKDWLKRERLTAVNFAREQGLSYGGLTRSMRGDAWPTVDILIRSFEASGGNVTMWDWLETCREKLTQDGIIENGERFHGEKTKQYRGRIPGKAREAEGVE